MTRGFRLSGDNALAALQQSIRSRHREDDNLHRVEHASGANINTRAADAGPSGRARPDAAAHDQRGGPPASSPGTLRPAVSAAPDATGAGAATRKDAGPWPRTAGSNPAAGAPLERDIQAAILALLEVHPRVAWAHRMNTGMAEYPGRDGTIRRVRFAFAGCPDILGQLKDGTLLAIEVKRADGRVTEDQVAFLSRAARHNAMAFVARSVDDVVRMLDDPRRAA